MGCVELVRSQFRAVCWQPTGLMGLAGAGWWLYVGNLQVLWGVLEVSFWMYVGTCGSYGVCWNESVLFMLATYKSHAGASLRLYVGNLRVLWGVLGPVWCQMLATYRSYGACWNQFGAVCWPYGVREGPVWGCMLANYGFYGVC